MFVTSNILQKYGKQESEPFKDHDSQEGCHRQVFPKQLGIGQATMWLLKRNKEQKDSGCRTIYI